MRKILANIIAGFIPFKNLRKRVRLVLGVPTRKYIKFAKSFSTSKHPRIKRSYGFRCINFVVTVDDKFVFKFPRQGNAQKIALREQRITDALRPISPIKIPKMEVLNLDGIAVRKYEYVRGVGWHGLDVATQRKHADKVGKQLAKFLYVVGGADPVAICDLKTRKTDRPAVMHGWIHDDLWDNFIMDPKTFDVVAVIDWENVEFGDFYDCFVCGHRNDAGQKVMLREYLKLLMVGNKK